MLLGLGWFQLPIFTNRSIFPVMGVMIMLTTIGCKHAPPHITVTYTALASDLVSLLVCCLSCYQWLTPAWPSA